VPDPCTPHSITTEELDNIAAYQAVRWKTGDVLFIRTGFVRWFDNAADGERRKKICGTEPAFIGVKTDDGSKEWLWNHHFSAVACDTLAFEGEAILNLCLYIW
jgi:kynurenine formamidase